MEQEEREERPGFRKELETVINRYSMENGSDTPDFILAEFLSRCLAAFDASIVRRDKWYGHRTLTSPGIADNQPPPQSS